MDVSGVELVKPSENPIIVITEDPDTIYDGDEDDSDIINEDSDTESLDNEIPDSKEETIQTTGPENLKTESSDTTKVEEEPEINENAIENNNEEVPEQNVDIENVEANENPVITNEAEMEEIAIAIENENEDKSSEITNVNEVEPMENTTADTSTESNDLVESTQESMKGTVILSESAEVEIQESNIPVEREDIKIEKKEVSKENINRNDAKPPAEVSNVQENPKIDQELINELVNLQRGWFDSNIRKQIKPTPKGWQLIHV